jgi:biopolymer transport protein ExbD
VKKSYKSGASESTAIGEINVTPLIDIVLVLLIIYMVVTPVMVHQMSVNLPEKTETVPEDKVPEEQILVAACEDGSFTVNREPKAIPAVIDSVRKKVLRKRAKGKKGIVFVDGHPEVSYESMVTLMDAVREAGRQADINIKIGLASLKPSDEFRACTEPEPAVVPAETPAPEDG